MQDLELKIELKKWLGIIGIGVVFSSLISTFIYYATSHSLLHGLVFGAIMGAGIASFSFLFITLLNRYLLPRVLRFFWGVLAALFSFLSGFLGSLFGFYVGSFFGIESVDKLSSNSTVVSLFLGVLTYLIGALLYQFVKTSNKEKKIESELYKSRLKSLETQLNPHFLFNSLNSLAELLYSDKTRCEKSIVELSSFLRDSMKEETLISIKKELENIQRYIYLENIRFEDAIELRESIDLDVQTVLIPKFSIQLLVENALKHGFKSGVEKFTIDISVKKGKKITIMVANSGVLDEFSMGIGLSNLNERLKLLCGGSVFLYNQNPIIFCIEIKRCNESFGS